MYVYIYISNNYFFLHMSRIKKYNIAFIIIIYFSFNNKTSFIGGDSTECELHNGNLNHNFNITCQQDFINSTGYPGVLIHINV